MSLAKTTGGVGASSEAPAPSGHIYRCEFCMGVVLNTHIHEFGGCKECGGRRVKVAFKLSDEEQAAAEAEGYDFDTDDFTADIKDAFHD